MSNSLKKTTINASYFPDGGQPSTAFTTEDHLDETAPPSIREESNENSAANSFEATRTNGQEKIVLVQFEDQDSEDPKQWSKAKKWQITILLCSMTMCIGLSTSAYSVGIGKMSAEFGVSEVAGQVGMFTFNAACAIAPLFFAPLCELTGRRFIYLIAFGLFVAITFLLAFGQNLASEIVGRLLQGAFGSIGTILVGGTLADCWSTEEISVPMSLFTFTAIFSTIAAPTYSGYIDQYLGWRWIQYIHLIFSGVVFIVEVLLLKETRGSAILTTRAKKLRKETGDNRFRAQAELEGDTLIDMFKQSSVRAIYLLVREPVVFLYGFYISLCWGVVFLFLSVIPLTFQGNHGWSEGNGGLPYIALILGCFFGFATGFWQDSLYNKACLKAGKPVPEARLYGAMIFGPCFPIGILIFSFTQYSFIHWIAPCFALFLIIVGVYHVFLSVYSYTSDSYQEFASSAIAGQGFMRNMFAASFPLFATQMFNEMGYQFAGLLLALIGFLIAPLPFVLFAKGELIRSKSKYAAANTGAGEPKIIDEESKVEPQEIQERESKDGETEKK